MKKQAIKIKTFAEIKKEWLKDPKVKKEYDNLRLEYALVGAIIEKRVKKGLTQKDLAQKIGTKQSSIARFESGGYNPTLLFVKKLADALGVTISVRV
ncbi:MAG: helix-turn-helix transcriptional regulator [Patescibacteria group bacterium]